MTVKEYLSRARSLDREIEAKLDHIEKLDAMVNRATPILSDMPGGTMDTAKRERFIVKMIDLKWEINAEIDKLVDIKSELNQFIGNIGNSNHRLLLELRYINICTWEKIAEIMDLSLSTVYRMHGSALIEAEKNYKNCQDDIV